MAMERWRAHLSPWPLPSAWDTLRMVPTEGPWSPAVEMFDRGDDLVVRFELPGVNAEEIKVSIQGDQNTDPGADCKCGSN